MHLADRVEPFAISIDVNRSGRDAPDEIREMMLEPARPTMVQVEVRGGKGSR